MPVHYTNYSYFFKVKDCQKLNHKSIHRASLQWEKGINLFNEAFIVTRKKETKWGKNGLEVAKYDR